MAVWTRPCSVFQCSRLTTRYSGTSGNGMIKSRCSILKSHISTVGLSLTLINSVRLPREAFRYGAVPYLVVYTLWLLVVGLATSLLQLATGQLSQQGPVGVWRAVPILRGVGHLQIITSFLCCVYNMIFVALSTAYIIWIGKDNFPLRVCTKIQMTPNGYENKINASECFSMTFLSSYTKHPEYLGIMAIITFLLWFFVPLLLYSLEKSYKIAMSIFTPIVLIMCVVLCSFLAQEGRLNAMLMPIEHWAVYTDPYIWFSTLVQALMSTQIMSGHLISSGGSIYKDCDVRLVSVAIISYNFLSGWLWVLFWQTLGGTDHNDDSFTAILVLIYESSITERRPKLWPLLAFGIIFLSGILTICVLLYPVYDRLHHLTADRWKGVAVLISALGTTLTLAVLLKAIHISTILDEQVVPALVIFSTTMQVVGFVFIYGYAKLRVDIEFLTGVKTSLLWVFFWFMTPLLLLGISGWWLKVLLMKSLEENKSLWPLGGTLIGILVVMSFIAAIAVAKEEQFNLISKIVSAFRSSRLWGPEDPTARYNWMVCRNPNDKIDNEETNSVNYYDSYPEHYLNSDVKQLDCWYNDKYLSRHSVSDKFEGQTGSFYMSDEPLYTENMYTNFGLPKHKTRDEIDKINTSDIFCIASDSLDSQTECKCNRHFKLNISEISTVL